MYRWCSYLIGSTLFTACYGDSITCFTILLITHGASWPAQSTPALWSREKATAPTGKGTPVRNTPLYRLSHCKWSTMAANEQRSHVTRALINKYFNANKLGLGRATPSTPSTPQYPHEEREKRGGMWKAMDCAMPSVSTTRMEVNILRPINSVNWNATWCMDRND
jgi:hypothetical protein